MKNTLYILFSFFVVSLFFSCKKEKDVVIDIGYNYFPDQVGRFVVYDVDSTYYDDSNIDVITHTAPKYVYKFQIKEKIESIFNDNLNRPTIRLERYVKYYNSAIPYNQMTWTLRNVWTENKTKTTAEKVEENIRFVKLAFPVNSSQNWNGNAQNTNAALNYSYSSIDVPLTLGLLAFDSTLQVNQQDETTLIDKKLSIEKYARKAGLIYKQIIDVGSQPTGLTGQSLTDFLNLPVMQRVTIGNQYTMTVSYYGTE